MPALPARGPLHATLTTNHAAQAPSVRNGVPGALRQCIVTRAGGGAPRADRTTESPPERVHDSAGGSGTRVGASRGSGIESRRAPWRAADGKGTFRWHGIAQPARK